jgi:CheY-like chemotaxis protein
VIIYKSGDHPKFDLCILDFDMLEMNGEELAKELRNIGLSIPIIILTGNTFLTIEKIDEKAGVEVVYHKPFTLQDVDYLIKRYGWEDFDYDFRNEKSVNFTKDESCYLYDGNNYIELPVEIINQSERGVGLSVRSFDLHYFSPGTEFTLPDGTPYSVRWSKIIDDKSLAGAARIIWPVQITSTMVYT